MTCSSAILNLSREVARNRAYGDAPESRQLLPYSHQETRNGHVDFLSPGLSERHAVRILQPDMFRRQPRADRDRSHHPG